MTADEQLTTLGFIRLGSDPKRKEITLWLCGGRQDILVQQTAEDTHASDVARLIYEAGCRDKADEISGRWKAFTEALRTPDLSETWTAARALQRDLQEAATAAASMPKPELQPSGQDCPRS